MNIETLEPLALSGAPDHAVEEATDFTRDRGAAPRKMLAYLNDHPARQMIDAARLMIFLKGDDAHDYKFSSAVFEDYLQISAPWRDRFLASGAVFLRGPKDKENPVVQQTRAALR